MLQKKLPVFLLFQNNCRMMDIIARNISSLVSGLVMASSAAVVNIVSLFNLSACFSSINFLLKFSVMNVSRKV